MTADTQNLPVQSFRYCFKVDGDLDDAQSAPFLWRWPNWIPCAENGRRCKTGLVFTDLAQQPTLLRRLPNTKIAKYMHSHDPPTKKAQAFALDLGAVWAGDSDESAPKELDAAIIFASVGALVPLALKAVRKGGIVICGGIHMTPIPTFSYDILWAERVVRSVANLTRQDAIEFLKLCSKNTNSHHNRNVSIKRREQCFITNARRHIDRSSCTAHLK